MDKPPPISHRSLLIPLFIGSGSLLGICLIFAMVRFRGQAAPIAPTQTLTPFKYLLLATLTDVPAPVRETATPVRNIFDPDGSADGIGALTPVPAGRIEPAGSPVDEEFTLTVTITPDPIFSESTPLAAGIYDDTDPSIIRVGTWINQPNVDDAYGQAILVSNSPGNYVAFSFIGQKMTLGYQSNGNGGDLTVNLDGVELELNLSVGNAWFSEELPLGIHYVILTHQGGASVNLDYVEVSE